MTIKSFSGDRNTLYFDLEDTMRNVVTLKVHLDSDLNFFISNPVDLDTDEIRNLMWPIISEKYTREFTDYNILLLLEQGYTVIELFNTELGLWRPLRISRDEYVRNERKYLDKIIHPLKYVLETLDEVTWQGRIVSPN